MANFFIYLQNNTPFWNEDKLPGKDQETPRQRLLPVNGP
jgi:hypothetical protein